MGDRVQALFFIEQWNWHQLYHWILLKVAFLKSLITCTHNKVVHHTKITINYFWLTQSCTTLFQSSKRMVRKTTQFAFCASRETNLLFLPSQWSNTDKKKIQENRKTKCTIKYGNISRKMWVFFLKSNGNSRTLACNSRKSLQNSSKRTK
jgi:hypothetical protein